MRKNQKGFSLIELMIVVGIILIIAAIAVPSLLSAKVAANETSAVASLRTLTAACETYSNMYQTYPPAISNLGPSAVPDPTAAGLIDEVLASGYKSGYNIVLVGGSPDANGNLLTYTINANPASTSSGNRYFYMDQSGVITWSATGPATSMDTPLQ